DGVGGELDGGVVAGYGDHVVEGDRPDADGHGVLRGHGLHSTRPGSTSPEPGWCRRLGSETATSHARWSRCRGQRVVAPGTSAEGVAVARQPEGPLVVAAGEVGG